MSINTDTFLEIKQYLDEALGDSLIFDTTTNIAANTSIVSTQLKTYDRGEDGYFNNWWVEITEGNNIGVKRLTGSTTYATATGTLTVYGAALAAEAGAVTIRMSRFDPNKKERAILRAVEEVYPSLHKKVDDMTLITGNILPDGHFESWSSASALTFYSTSNITLARTSTNALHRGGYYSAKATAGADNGYFYISSDSYPRLLDLQDQVVDFYVWAYPEVANDASIVIYTIKNDGTTTQTLASTTSCAAGVWTQLKLESQTLNDDLEEIQIRFKVATNTKYAYFDDAYLSGMRLSEYLLPPDFITGSLRQVFIQTQGNMDEAFYDLHPFSTQFPGLQIPFNIINDGTNQYLKLDDYLSERRLRLIGDKILESLSSYTDTITIDSERVPLLIAKAREIFWKREATAISSEDRSRYKQEAYEAEMDYRKLLTKFRMSRDVEYIRRTIG